LVDTFQALGVLLLALLPGAIYVWAFEREAGGWGLGVTDRLLRFVGVSAVFHVVAAPITYILYQHYIVTGELAHGKPISFLLWLAAVVYVAIPAALGAFVGNATAGGKGWTRFIVGRSPAPRAWDHLFSAHDLNGWVRLKLKNDEWVIGAYARSDSGRLRSYAAGYPNAQDLYLLDTAECEPHTGKFILARGQPKLRGVGVLVRWEEVLYLEFIDSRTG
jgi:Family of unknown function (DUF6338)